MGGGAMKPFTFSLREYCLLMVGRREDVIFFSDVATNNFALHYWVAFCQHMGKK